MKPKRWIAIFDSHGDMLHRPTWNVVRSFMREWKPQIRIHGGNAADGGIAMKDETTPQFAALFAVLIAMFVGAVVIPGCRLRQPNTATVTTATTQAAISNHAIKADVAEAARLGTVAKTDAKAANVPVVVKTLDRQGDVLANASVRLEKQDDELAKVAKALDAYHAESERVIAAWTDKYNGEKTRREAAEKKYHDAWLGGRTWAWIRGISLTLGIIAVAALLLNYYTDAFVIAAKPVVWAVVGVIGGFCKFCWHALVSLVEGIAKLFKRAKSE